MYKHGSKKKIAQIMKDNKGRTMTDREKILEICKDFKLTLYKKMLLSPTNMQNVSPNKYIINSFANHGKSRKRHATDTSAIVQLEIGRDSDVERSDEEEKM